MADFKDEYPILFDLLTEILQEQKTEVEKLKAQGVDEEADEILELTGIIDEIEDLFDFEFEEDDEDDEEESTEEVPLGL